MDAVDFENALGLSEESAEVSGLLKALGVTKKLKLTPEGNVRLTMPERGLLLSFKPEDPKSSRLRFTGVQFYSDAEQGFTPFPGKLPRGLEFSFSPKEARAALGKPTKIMKDFRLDHWISADGRQLTIRYRKSLDGIAYVLSGFAPDTKS